MKEKQKPLFLNLQNARYAMDFAKISVYQYKYYYMFLICFVTHAKIYEMQTNKKKKDEKYYISETLQPY